MGYFYAIAAAVVWGLVYALDQRILEKISPSMLMFINGLFAVLILLPLLLLQTNEFKDLIKMDKSTIKLISIVMILSLVASLLIFYAIQHLGSPKAAIFEIAYPFFVVIFSYFLFQSSVNGYFMLGTLLLFIGSAIIIKLG